MLPSDPVANAPPRRRAMIERQLVARGIRDPALLAAFATVPRERFVSPSLAAMAYDDSALPIEEGQTISQPYVVGVMIQALEVQPTDVVLEVGAGSGYAAAILGCMARRVFAIERLPALADSARGRLRDLGFDNVEIVCGDGTRGLPRHAPFDGIVVAAGAPAVPASLQEQLRVGGRLVIPEGETRGSQVLVRLRRLGPDEWSRDTLGAVRFVPLVGDQGWDRDL